MLNETRPIDPSYYGEPGAAGATSSNLVLACSAEAIGTFLLVLVGTAVAAAAVLGKGTAGPAYNSRRKSMNTPKVQDDVVPVEGGSSAANPEGRTPMGIPTEATEGDPAADPTSDRFATEVAALKIEKEGRPTSSNG